MTLAEWMRLRWRWLAVIGALGVALAGFMLYAMLLNVDLSEAQRRLKQEVTAHQQTQHYLAETRAHLTEKNREVAELTEQIASSLQDFDAEDSSKPALPVDVEFRDSFLGRGRVAELRNTGSQFLTVIVVARNPTLAKARRFRLDLAPESSTALGHLEGWQFASGDELALYHEGYAVRRVIVP